MRPVGLGDLTAAAGALAAVPPGRRRGLMALLLTEAESADRFRAAEGRAHPFFGNGSLMSAALAHPQAPLVPGAPEGLALLALALDAVLDRLAAPGGMVRPGAGGWQNDTVGLSVVG